MKCLRAGCAYNIEGGCFHAVINRHYPVGTVFQNCFYFRIRIDPSLTNDKTIVNINQGKEGVEGEKSR